MKKFICLLAILMLGACSSDDNNDSEDFGGNIPAEEKFLNSFSTGTGTISLIYNNDKTVKRLMLSFNESEAYIFDFKYTNGNVSQVTGIVGGNSGTIYFQHQNNVITGFRYEGDDLFTQLQYNAQTNAYTFIEDDEEYLIDLTESGDLEKYYSEDEYTAEANCVLLYDEDDDKFGNMTNTNNIHPYIALVFPQMATFMGLFSKKPLNTISVNQATMQCENQYYNDGFLKSTYAAFGQDGQTYTYKYTTIQDTE